MDWIFPLIFAAIGFLLRAVLPPSDLESARLRDDARYWRRAYESLVAQTGRDLGDGLGLDPRARSSRPRPG